MKENKFSLVINKPLSEVYNFAINPINTPNWADSIIEEVVNEFPIKEGTIYKNMNLDGEWSEFLVSKFKENEIFELTDKNSNYRVRYTFKPISESETELNYFEWMEEGELVRSFQFETLKKLKSIIESS